MDHVDLLLYATSDSQVLKPALVACGGTYLLNILAGAKASIVDQDIKAPKLLDGISNACAHRCLICDVQLLYMETAGCTAQCVM